MLRQLNKRLALQCLRRFSTTNQSKYKVACLGAAGGIGQPLSMLLKMNNLVTELAMYDMIEHTPGIVADVSHMDTNCTVKPYTGKEELPAALKCSDIVAIPAGVPRKPGMSRDDLIETNAAIVKELICEIARYCPKALIVLITNPINITVPIAAEILKAENAFDPNRLFGATTLDVVRAKSFIGDYMQLDPQKVSIPVIGGHAGKTIIPLFSQCKPKFTGDEEVIVKLIKRIQDAGTEVVEAKQGRGSATLSMAYAASKFINSLILGLNGERDIIECSYVCSTATEAEYFSTPLELGKQGIKANKGLPQMDEFERCLVDNAMPELMKSIEKGVEYARKNKNKKKK